MSTPNGAYIGVAACGCMMMACVDYGDKRTATWVAEAIECGLTVSHVTLDEAKLIPFDWHEAGDVCPKVAVGAWPARPPEETRA